MQRNEELFPLDNVGNALWDMLSSGDDLTIEREFEFSIIFPNQEQALKFGQLLLENNQKLLGNQPTLVQEGEIGKTFIIVDGKLVEKK